MDQKRKKRKKGDPILLTGKTVSQKIENTTPLQKRVLRLHFRRCHLCSGVTEKEETPVERCDHCGKPMAPFYFFNDLEVVPISDFELRDNEETLAGIRRPLRGFTAQW